MFVKGIQVEPKLSEKQLKKVLDPKEFAIIAEDVAGDAVMYHEVFIEFERIHPEMLNAIRVTLMNMIETYSLTCLHTDIETGDYHILVDHLIRQMQMLGIDQELMAKICADQKPETFQEGGGSLKHVDFIGLSGGSVQNDRLFMGVDLSLEVDNSTGADDKRIYSGDIKFKGKPVTLFPKVVLGKVRSGHSLRIKKIHPILNNVFAARRYNIHLALQTVRAHPGEPEHEGDPAFWIKYDTLCGCKQEPLSFLVHAIDIMTRWYNDFHDELKQIKDDVEVHVSENLEYHRTSEAHHGDSTLKLKSAPSCYGWLLKRSIYDVGIDFVTGDRTHRTEHDILIIFRHADPIILLRQSCMKILEILRGIYTEIPDRVKS